MLASGQNVGPQKKIGGELNQLHIKNRTWAVCPYHFNTRLSHSDIAATQITATPVRLLKKYVKGKTSRKAALGSPMWVATSHIFWRLIIVCWRLSAIQMPCVWTASIPASFNHTTTAMQMVWNATRNNLYFRKFCYTGCSTGIRPLGGALVHLKFNKFVQFNQLFLSGSFSCHNFHPLLSNIIRKVHRVVQLPFISECLNNVPLFQNGVFQNDLLFSSCFFFFFFF